MGDFNEATRDWKPVPTAARDLLVCPKCGEQNTPGRPGLIEFDPRRLVANCALCGQGWSVTPAPA